MDYRITTHYFRIVVVEPINPLRPRGLRRVAGTADLRRAAERMDGTAIAEDDLSPAEELEALMRHWRRRNRYENERNGPDGGV